MPYSPRATQDNPYGPQVQFRTEDVLPPSAEYLGPDDYLAIVVLTNQTGLTYNFVGRLLTPTGEVKVLGYTFPGPASGTFITSLTLPPVEGYLLSAMVFTQGSPNGSTLGRLQVIRGQTVPPPAESFTLTQGYFSNYGGISWPNYPPQQVFSGPGWLKTSHTTPAAGADATVTVPAGTLWEVMGISVALTTSAAAGTRGVALEAADASGNVFLYQPLASSITASAAATAYAAAGLGAANDGAGHYTAPLPSKLQLAQGWTLRTLTSGLQAGDQLSVVVEYWEWMGL